MKLDMQELSLEAIGVVDQELTKFVLPEPAKDRAKEIFLKAYELVKNRSTWCQGAFERVIGFKYKMPTEETLVHMTASECIIAFEQEPAFAYCSMGAIGFADSGTVPKHTRFFSSSGRLVLKALERTMGQDIAYFNDVHAHADVVNAWRVTGHRMGWL